MFSRTAPWFSVQFRGTCTDAPPHAERDENTCREPLRPLEMHAMKQRLAAAEKQLAKERQKQGGKQAGRGRPKGSAESAAPIKRAESRERIAAAVGTSHDTLSKLDAIVSKGSEELKDAVDAGAVSVNAAAALAGVTMPHCREGSPNWGVGPLGSGAGEEFHCFAAGAAA